MKKQKESKKEAKKEYDCTSCGACCAYFFEDNLGEVGRSGYGMWISNDPGAPRLPKKLVVIEPILDTYDAYLRGKKVDGQWRCKSLEGNMGEQVACSIYDIRPRTCINFEPGSEGCIRARQSLGLGN
jgi:uncharacterized protein